MNPYIRSPERTEGTCQGSPPRNPLCPGAELKVSAKVYTYNRYIRITTLRPRSAVLFERSIRVYFLIQALVESFEPIVTISLTFIVETEKPPNTTLLSYALDL